MVKTTKNSTWLALPIRAAALFGLWVSQIFMILMYTVVSTVHVTNLLFELNKSSKTDTHRCVSDKQVCAEYSLRINNLSKISIVKLKVSVLQITCSYHGGGRM